MRQRRFENMFGKRIEGILERVERRDDLVRGTELLPGEWFAREDETNDAKFYRESRLTVHVDDETIESARSYFAETLPRDRKILDLMSSWRSHLPHDLGGTVTGLGMNRVELDENPQLDERVVHDLNADPRLPFDDARFDAAVVTVSVQYLTRPVEVFREVRRVLRPGAVFHVLFSSRVFPTKAIAIWLSLLSPTRRADLISAYFRLSGSWIDKELVDRSPAGADPLYIVRASRPK